MPTMKRPEYLFLSATEAKIVYLGKTISLIQLSTLKSNPECIEAFVKLEYTAAKG
jgi:hypothetical protein